MVGNSQIQVMSSGSSTSSKKGLPKPTTTIEVHEINLEKNSIHGSVKPSASNSWLQSVKKTLSNVREKNEQLLRNTRFIAVVLLLFGIALLVTVYCLGSRALGTEEAVRNGFTWFRISLPLYETPCDELAWPLRFISIFVNLFSTVVMVFSSTIQSQCTSPDLAEIKHEMLKHGDFEFGSNHPYLMIRRRRWGSLAVWITMVLTSLPLTLLFNAAFGQSNGFSSIEALAAQTETGICRIIMRPWISFIVAIMVIIKAIVILLYLWRTDHNSLEEETYNCLGDIICASLDNPDLVANLNSMEDSRLSIRTSRQKRSHLISEHTPKFPHELKRYPIRHITWGELLSFGGMIFMALSILLDVGVDYESPQGFSIRKQIQVILAVNVPQLACSGLLYLFQELMNRRCLEQEWMSFARKTKIPRTELKGRSERDPRMFEMPIVYGIAMILYSTLCHFALAQMQDIAEIYIQPDIILMGFTWSAQRHAFIATLYALPILPIFIVLGLWLYPARTQMPLMQGSGRVVLAACSELCKEPALPAAGIQWGDLGPSPHDTSVRIAGFGSSVGRIRSESLYL